MLIKENHEMWSDLVLTTQTWTIALGVDSLRKLKGFSIMVVGETHGVVEGRVWHDFHCDYPEAVVSDCYSHPQIIWSCHPTEKMKWNFVPFKHTHLSFLGGAKNRKGTIMYPREVLWHTHWHLAWLYVLFTKRTATIPTPKASSGWERH